MSARKITDEELIEALRRTLVRHYGQNWDCGSVSVADVKRLVDKDIDRSTMSRRLKTLAGQGKAKYVARGYYMWADDGKAGE